ncbi:MAG: DnaD domain protein [Anaerolineales bacterium]|nr:DnaD domain protein [Anaerolineales bacterium]
MTFKGFTDSESFIQLPDTFFQKLLAEIEDTAELKVTLFFLWRVEHMEGPFRALCQTDFEEKALGLSAEEVATGLESAVRRGSMLKAEHEADAFYFLNSPRGRAAAEAFTNGNWRESARIMSAPVVERPNVFKLYEENIGPLTPMIADMLKDAEETYSQEWIAEALEIAVKNNIRNWKYVEAILRRWKEKGKHEGKDQQDAGKGSERYTKSEFEEYL